MDFSPILCFPILKEKVWGGKALKTLLNKELPNPDKIYGESWEVSTHPQGSAIIRNGLFKGQVLSELLQSPEGERILGSQIWKKHSGKLPLLIKFLDIEDKISIQVHPNDEDALSYENNLGKAEAWYIIDASPDATLIMGVKDNVTKKIFEENINPSSIPKLFNQVRVQAGDIVSIPPGLVHGILSGSILACEIQQNSDVTYRLYDYDRHDPNKDRPLHLDIIKNVIDFDAKTEIKKHNPNIFGEETLLDWPYFKVNKRNILEDFRMETSKIEFWIVLSGDIFLTGKEVPLHLNKGDVCLIPVNYAGLASGRGKILRVFIK